MKKEIILKIIWILLLLGSFGDWDYFYYQILRWYISGLSLYLAYTYYENKEKEHWIWIFWISATAFNPIAPIHFWRELWGILDIIMWVILSYSIYELDSINKKTKH